MNKLMQKVKNKKGFTLIELIVVIAILGILVLLAAPRFLGYTKDANKATMQADIKVLTNSALVYNIENEDTWPKTEEVAEVKAEIQTKLDILDPADEAVVVNKIDANKIDDHIQSLKGDVSEYGIITKGALKGEIVHLKGVEDRKGITHFGLGMKLD